MPTAVYRRRAPRRPRRRFVGGVASGSSATAYTLTGPSGGLVGSASSNFTVQATGTLGSSVIVTPSDGGKLGSFSPTTATLAAGTNTSATFTYTPLYYGSITVSTTNDGGLTDPSSKTYTTTLPAGSGLSRVIGG
jgi:hypothetical protein